MKIYLVGGAVRDSLLQLPVKDRDWLVIGATPEELLQQGYQQVGRDFPVFLHPKTGEEYALARTERKCGTGYTGFICDFSPHISLEEDLLRRDLSINAIAQDEQGNLYDPYNGIQDLIDRTLRHVSPAFCEDPLRVLRVARFAASFHYLGFHIAPETLQLMQSMSDSGELTQLSAERIWLETEKALQTLNPEIYFYVLHQVGALKVLFPELYQLNGVPNPIKHHPEVDSFIHTMLVLQQATQLSLQQECHRTAVRFAAICHDLGKALTPKEILPHHKGHEERGILPTKQLCQRLKLPAYLQELAELTCQYHSHIHKAFALSPEAIIELFEHVDAWRKPQRFQEIMLVCLADTRGRQGFEQQSYPQREFMWEMYQTALQVDVQHIIQQGFKQKAIRQELNRQRIEAITQKRAKILPPLPQFV